MSPFGRVKWRHSRIFCFVWTGCRLFSILAIFLDCELFRGSKIVGMAKAEGGDPQNELQHSFLPNIQIRAGRPLADVSENLHWHDEAIPLSVEEDEAAIVDDEVPEFTMGPFLEKAFSMDPSKTTKQNAGGNTNSPPAQLIHRRLPIHEADLPNAIIRGPTPKNINSLGRIFSSTNIPKINSTKEIEKNEKGKEMEGHKNKTNENENNNSNSTSMAPNNANKNNKIEHCSWQMLNIFLLVWSIISTLHWIWLCSSKIFGFMHFMEISHAKGGQNVGKMKQQRAKMMALMNGQKNNGKYANGIKSARKNSEQSNGSTTLVEEKKREWRRGTRPIAAKRQSGPNKSQNMPPGTRPHRTIISIPNFNNEQNGSISQKMRRMAARKTMAEKNKKMNGNGKMDGGERKAAANHLMYY